MASSRCPNRATTQRFSGSDPRERGIIPLDGFHVSRSLARRIRSGQFQITTDTDFEGVVAGCADREETWISHGIAALYAQLHRMGAAHSLEVRDGDALVGGVYGVTIGAAFFGESMFSRRTDASKVALAYLTDRLNRAGFTLFDTQFLTPHLASLGGIEIPGTSIARGWRQPCANRRTSPPPACRQRPISCCSAGPRRRNAGVPWRSAPGSTRSSSRQTRVRHAPLRAPRDRHKHRPRDCRTDSDNRLV